MVQSPQGYAPFDSRFAFTFKKAGFVKNLGRVSLFDWNIASHEVIAITAVFSIPAS
jgi:hypothetical protein